MQHNVFITTQVFHVHRASYLLVLVGWLMSWEKQGFNCPYRSSTCQAGSWMRLQMVRSCRYGSVNVITHRRSIAERGTTYLYLRLMGYVASQLKMPISCKCRSSLFLNALIDGASMTSCGNLFHSLTIRELKKFCLIVLWHLGLNSFNECPLSPLVTSASSKKCCSWHVPFQLIS